MRSFVSVLYREPKLLKVLIVYSFLTKLVSVLYREPKLLKATRAAGDSVVAAHGFSALP